MKRQCDPTVRSAGSEKPTLEPKPEVDQMTSYIETWSFEIVQGATWVSLQYPLRYTRGQKIFIMAALAQAWIWLRLFYTQK